VSENGNDQPSKAVTLTVDSGVPLRVYLTKRLSKRLDEPVHARVLEPVFAFDREVIPAGTEVLGRVSHLGPVSKMERANAILGGDFTPLHEAEVEFTTLMMPDGRQMSLHTAETPGLSSLVDLKPPKKAKAPKNGNPGANGGVLGAGKKAVKDQINSTISARTRGVADIVRAPDKLERLEDFLLVKLPYHPQWIRKGTRFDASLREPLQFGSATVKPETLQLLGSPPPADSVVHARLITPLNSATAKQGEKVRAILSQPLFSPAQTLILPAGAQLTGTVTMARPARWFHRGGQLRFNFETIDLPPGLPAQSTDNPVGEIKTSASLQGAESGSANPVKVDEEGAVKVAEPKTRLIAPAIAGLIAAKTLDNDTGRRTGRTETNTGGRTLGGVSGLGLLGGLIAQSSRTFGSAMGFYGMGWSVYTNVVARGGEVDFGQNTAMDIRFGLPPNANSKPRKAMGKLGAHP